MGISPQGINVVKFGGDTHLLDWVGVEFAPNAIDIMEEGWRIGWSRHIPSSFNFAQIRPGMRLLLAHPRGWIGPLETGAPARFWEERVVAQLGRPTFQWWAGERDDCPQKVVGHARTSGEYPPVNSCVGLLWEDCAVNDSGDDRVTTRTLPCGTYKCAKPVVNTEHHLAIIAILPVGQIAVVRGDHGEHENTLRKAQAAGVPVALTDY
jgi:hypothetical protein